MKGLFIVVALLASRRASCFRLSFLSGSNKANHSSSPSSSALFSSDLEDIDSAIKDLLPLYSENPSSEGIRNRLLSALKLSGERRALSLTEYSTVLFLCVSHTRTHTLFIFSKAEEARS